MSQKLIFVLGEYIAQSADGKWHTLDEDDCDAFGIMYDRWRVEAAAVIGRAMNCRLIVSGGVSDQDGVDSDVTISSVMKRELVERGVPAEVIEEDSTSFNTYQQLVWLANYLVEKEASEVFVVTNAYHIPRVKAFIAYAPDLALLRTALLFFVDCEATLIAADAAKWCERIERAQAKPAFAERVALELRGAGRIERGEYPFK